MDLNVIVLGPAGSGKSLLTENFLVYLRDRGYSSVAVNLDTASPPRYEAFRDIRDYVKTEEVMDRFQLGINGALLKSMEIAGSYVDRLAVSGYDFVLYDTPGQLELFLFSDFGIELIERLEGFTAGLFIVDSSRIKDAARFSAMVSQSATISLMLEIPSLTVFNKVDLHVPQSIEKYRSDLENEGVLGEFFECLLRFIEVTSMVYRPVLISARNGYGFDDLFSALNELFCACGDLS
ncbi:ATP/GTP-binding protein [Geoglobus acetivorans]|uniref:ATP/GTP-binding protein n=1 Tax=Geoglobus acetivorans TaxID=565033 RepID=A0ABZ3H5J4_GEOAI